MAAVLSGNRQVEEVAANVLSGNRQLEEVAGKVNVMQNHLVNILILILSMYTDILIDKSFRDSACQVCFCIFSKV